MARSLAVVRPLCALTPRHEDILQHPSGPILVLDRQGFNEWWGSGGEGRASLATKKQNVGEGEPSPTPPRFHWDLLNPEDGGTLGIMLPTTPLHHLLFQPLAGDDLLPFDLLVVTSGNRSGEPLCTETEEALARLGDIADLFLCHDRDTSCAARTIPSVSSRIMDFRCGAGCGGWYPKPCASLNLCGGPCWHWGRI